MGAMAVRVFSILLAIAFMVLFYIVTIWVLALLGIVIPHNILTVVFVIIGLICAIGVLTGRFDNFWPRPPGTP